MLVACGIFDHQEEGRKGGMWDIPIPKQNKQIAWRALTPSNSSLHASAAASCRPCRERTAAAPCDVCVYTYVRVEGKRME